MLPSEGSEWSNDQPMRLPRHFELITNFQNGTSAPDSHLLTGFTNACRVYKNSIIAHRQAQNSPRSKRKAYEEEIPSHNSNGILYCKQPPRLHESFDLTRKAHVKPFSSNLEQSQDVPVLQSSVVVPFLCSAMLTVYSWSSLGSQEPRRARCCVTDSNTA